MKLTSLPQDYRAVIAGATGGIGKAFLDHVQADPRCKEAIGLSRSTEPSIDFEDEATIENAAEKIGGPVHLFIDATGFLSDEETQPEKSLDAITPQAMAKLFVLNATGPALLMKHFAPLFPRGEHVIFATLSARVGSIGDNRLGGWYAYRASKTALNMLLRNLAIEIGRTHKKAVCVALHPGTVETPLSDPFAGKRDRFSPEKSTELLLGVLNDLEPEQSGGFFDYEGTAIEW